MRESASQGPGGYYAVHTRDGEVVFLGVELDRVDRAVVALHANQLTPLVGACDRANTSVGTCDATHAPSFRTVQNACRAPQRDGAVLHATSDLRKRQHRPPWVERVGGGTGGSARTSPFGSDSSVLAPHASDAKESLTAARPSRRSSGSSPPRARPNTSSDEWLWKFSSMLPVEVPAAAAATQSSAPCQPAASAREQGAPTASRSRVVSNGDHVTLAARATCLTSAMPCRTMLSARGDRHSVQRMGQLDRSTWR
jgi:hypothetical protein